MNVNNDNYTAKTLFGLEEILSNELNELGATKVSASRRIVKFNADLKTLYKINLSARTALRILKPIISFSANNPDQLYQQTKTFDWTTFIGTDNSFAIDSVVNSEKFKHSKFAALKMKDAIVDKIRSEKGNRPDIDVLNPTFRLNLHIDNDKCTISLDASGESLHKRGYRLKGERAPLNEVLAAGMILLSDWDKSSDFIDPMCGSGTIVIEAALIAQNIPPNINRTNFGFMNWNSFDEKLFKTVRQELISNKTEFKKMIHGSDINKSAIKSAIANAKRAKVDNFINFSISDFKDIKNTSELGTIITNPPYGERIKTENIELLYKEFGDTLKQSFNGFDAWILSSNKNALKKIGLRTSKRLALFNGSLECKFHNYKLYKGSLKKKFD